MMRIRDERVEDERAVRALNVSAFDAPAEANLVDRLRREADSFISLVAEDEGKVIGHIMFTPVTVSNPEQPEREVSPEKRMMGLAPMAVASANQRQGVGGALVRAGLERCAQGGYGAVIVLGHPDYYPRFGFQTAAAYGLASEYNSPPEAFMVIELQPGFLSDVSGRVSYHPAFKDL